jgi:hypothetical protein
VGETLQIIVESRVYYCNDVNLSISLFSNLWSCGTWQSLYIKPCVWTYSGQDLLFIYVWTFWRCKRYTVPYICSIRLLKRPAYTRVYFTAISNSNLARHYKTSHQTPLSFYVGKDFICVASMDGMLSFFEQEMFAFGRFLPGFLLPSPVRYVAKTDSFVTCSSSRMVECYKYVKFFLWKVW